MISRRTLIRNSIFATCGNMALAVLGEKSAEAAPKISKSMARYQDTPNENHQCAACCMFVPGQPDHCTMIEGIVGPDGWCKYWQAGAADTCS